jgi:hypothetical protein
MTSTPIGSWIAARWGMRAASPWAPATSAATRHNAAYNPTGLVGALTYWAADAIRQRYLKHPGPLVQA